MEIQDPKMIEMEKSVLNEFEDILVKFAFLISILQKYPSVNSILHGCLKKVINTWNFSRPLQEQGTDSICAMYQAIQYTLQLAKTVQKSPYGIDTEKICSVYDSYEARIKLNSGIISVLKPHSVIIAVLASATSVSTYMIINLVSK